MSELTNEELTRWEATVRTDSTPWERPLLWERRAARLLAEVRQLQELDRVMIEKLGEMTERAYRAEAERDEARAEAVELAVKLLKREIALLALGERSSDPEGSPYFPDPQPKKPEAGP